MLFTIRNKVFGARSRTAPRRKGASIDGNRPGIGRIERHHQVDGLVRCVLREGVGGHVVAGRDRRPQGRDDRHHVRAAVDAVARHRGGEVARGGGGKREARRGDRQLRGGRAGQEGHVVLEVRIAQPGLGLDDGHLHRQRVRRFSLARQREVEVLQPPADAFVLRLDGDGGVGGGRPRHRHHVGLRGGHVLGRHLHLDDVVAGIQVHLEIVQIRVGVRERDAVAVQVLDRGVRIAPGWQNIDLSVGVRHRRRVREQSRGEGLVQRDRVAVEVLQRQGAQRRVGGEGGGCDGEAVASRHTVDIHGTELDGTAIGHIGGHGERGGKRVRRRVVEKSPASVVSP